MSESQHIIPALFTVIAVRSTKFSSEFSQKWGGGECLAPPIFCDLLVLEKNLTLFKGVGDKDSETCKQLSKVTPVNNTRRQTSRAAKRLNILNRWHGIEYDNHFF